MPGDAIEHRNFINIIHDIALLSSLGVRLVVAFGDRPQIQSRLDDAGLESTFSRGLRVTPDDHLPLVMEAIGGLRAYVESQLSMGLVNSPMHNARIRVRSEEHTSELQSRPHLVCRLLLEKKKGNKSPCAHAGRHSQLPLRAPDDSEVVYQ